MALPEDVRALITAPFDLGSFDKDVGWCADRFAIEIADDETLRVHRSGDQEGAQPWARDESGRVELVDRALGVVHVRVGALLLVFDLEAGRHVGHVFAPSGELALSAPPLRETLHGLLARISGIFVAAELASPGPLAFEEEGELVRVSIGGAPMLSARVTLGPDGEPQHLEIRGTPPRRLELFWSAPTPLLLRVTPLGGIVLPARHFAPLRRALRRGLSWQPRPALVRVLVRHLVEHVLASPEPVEVSSRDDRSQSFDAVSRALESLAALAPDVWVVSGAVAADSLREGLSAASGPRDERTPRIAKQLLELLGQGTSPTPRQLHADACAVLALMRMAGDGSAASDEARAHARRIAPWLAASLRAHAGEAVPPPVLAALAEDDSALAEALDAWWRALS